MKIESVKPYPMRIKAREKLTGGTFEYAHFQTVLVKATVDGVEGWGEAMTRFDPEATALTVKYLAKLIEGRHFSDVGSAWADCWKELRIRGHTRGTDVEALSGVELALHDSAGKIQREPLGKLFAATLKERVPVFAGSLFRSRGPLESQVEAAKRMGLMGAKVKIGFGVEKDRATLESVRRMWPDGMLVGDANGAYDQASASKACRAFASLGLAWFEEPVLSDDLAGYASLRDSGVKIGGGESWFAGDFVGPLERNLVDVIEPSVSRCGGMAIEMRVAQQAAERGVGFSPMTGMNSAISLVASLHAASAVESLGVEYNPFANPLQTDLVSGLEEPKDGSIAVPRAPGLGVEVDQRFVKSHSG